MAETGTIRTARRAGLAAQKGRPLSKEEVEGLVDAVKSDLREWFKDQHREQLGLTPEALNSIIRH